MYSVVLIDDEKFILEDIKATFPWKEYGFYVTEAFSSSQLAQEYILNSPPDVVLCDIKMPRISGLDLMTRLRSLGNKSIFVIVSGFSDFSYAQQAIRCGASDYIVKPVGDREAHRVLKQLKVQLSGGDAACYVPQSETNQDLFKKILVYIDDNILSGLTLGEVADKHFITKNYLCILFKKHLDTTFSSYVNKIKITQAVEMIKSSDNSLEWISQKLDFCDYYYFSKVFKKFVGLSPKSYKKYCQEKSYEKNR